MADTARPIASAVILPETEAPPSPRPAKRRQSSASESTFKRPRTSHGSDSTSPTALRESPQPISSSKETVLEKKDVNADRRKSSVQEERKRGQRLFGGLLSTLSQSTPNGRR
jgi:hypothetical protein